MVLLRNGAFYLFVLVNAPFFIVAMTLANVIPIPKWWPSSVGLKYLLWGLRHTCGLDHKVEGLERLPRGPCLIASAQQSTWENLAFPLIFSNPAIWVKTSLCWVPTIGWVAHANDYIATDRGGSIDSTRAALEKSREHIAKGRSVLIFTEGTRRTVAGHAVLKSGTRVLYGLLDKPCVPVVLNSGRFWPKGGLIRSGTITVEVLEPIEPGLSRTVFENALKTALDTGTLRLAALPG